MVKAKVTFQMTAFWPVSKTDEITLAECCGQVRTRWWYLKDPAHWREIISRQGHTTTAKESTAVVKEVVFRVKTVVTTEIQATVRELSKSGSLPLLLP